MTDPTADAAKLLPVPSTDPIKDCPRCGGTHYGTPGWCPMTQEPPPGWEPRPQPVSCDHEWETLQDGAIGCRKCYVDKAVWEAAQERIKPAPPAGERTFWVVEQFKNGQGGAYWMGGHSRDFTPSIDQAIQFCRRQDALWVIFGWHWGDVQITEHAYLGPRRAAQGRGCAGFQDREPFTGIWKGAR